VEESSEGSEQGVETGQNAEGQQSTVEVLNTDDGQSVQEAELIYRTVEEIQLSDRLEITQVSLSDQDIFSTEEAVHAIIDEMDRLGEGVSFVEYSTWQGTYQEEPVVETTDTLFQVETELLSEGVPGTLEYTTVSQFQNGLETDTEVEEATVLQQGTPAVMLQGSLECPDYQWPVTERWITSGFGERWEEQHKGLDIGVVTGTSVCAAAAGEVLRAETIGTYGKCIIIDHGNGQETRYAHLSEILVEPGDTVSAGQEIGLSGNTGNSTGPHLHFEIRVDGEAIDPLRLLPE
jgi:murein DD-endopeptidase MepM/ murein hydrolase activator NlpD